MQVTHLAARVSPAGNVNTSNCAYSILVMRLGQAGLGFSCGQGWHYNDHYSFLSCRKLTSIHVCLCNVRFTAVASAARSANTWPC